MMIGKVDVRTFEALFGIGSIIFIGILFFTTCSIDASHNDFMKTYPLTIEASKVVIGVIFAVSYIYFKHNLDKERERKDFVAGNIMRLLCKQMNSLKSLIIGEEGGIIPKGILKEKPNDLIQAEQHILTIKTILENENLTLKLIEGSQKSVVEDYIQLKLEFPVFLKFYELVDASDFSERILATFEMPRAKTLFEIASKYV